MGNERAWRGTKLVQAYPQSPAIAFEGFSDHLNAFPFKDAFSIRIQTQGVPVAPRLSASVVRQFSMAGGFCTGGH